MSSDPNWQLPGEGVTRRIASSKTGAMLWVGCRVDQPSSPRLVTGVVASIDQPGPAQRVRVEWADGATHWHAPGDLIRVGDARANEAHAEVWLQDRGLPAPRPPAIEALPAVPAPPSVEHDRHYVQVAFDEPTCQLLSAVLSVHIGQMARLDEKAVLTPEGQRDLQLSRRARAQLLYGYAQWLEGGAS